MTFEVRPYPDSWSISRQRKLDQCPRAYFYTYYLDWNGWLDDAPTAAAWRTAWASSPPWTRCSGSRSTCGRGSSRQPPAPARRCPRRTR